MADCLCLRAQPFTTGSNSGVTTAPPGDFRTTPQDAAQSGLDDYVYTMHKEQPGDIESFESWGTVFLCALKAPLRDLPALPKV